MATNIIQHSQTTKHTKTVQLSFGHTNVDSLVGENGTAFAWADSDNNWYMWLWFRCAYTTRSVPAQIHIDGVVFKDNPTDTPYPVSDGVVAVSKSSLLRWDNDTPHNETNCSGIVPLECAPTWALANMENKIDASICIESAGANKPGLLDHQEDGIFEIQWENPDWLKKPKPDHCTARYVRMGKQVTLFIPAFQGEGLGNFLWLGGAPNSILSNVSMGATQTKVYSGGKICDAQFRLMSVVDNSVLGSRIAFWCDSKDGNFKDASTKGLQADTVVTYILP